MGMTIGLRIGLSIGLALAPLDGHDAADLIRTADGAMAAVPA